MRDRRKECYTKTTDCDLSSQESDHVKVKKEEDKVQEKKRKKMKDGFRLYYGVSHH
jgi:hypothetical protein